jgi:hypothetical protein
LIVGLGGNVKVLQVSLSVESDLSSLHFSVLLVNLVANQNDGDVVANSSQILVPLGNVFVGDSSGDIKHEDSGIGSNVVSLSESAQLLLASGIPNTQLDWSVVSIKGDGADFNTLGGNVFLLELTGDMSFDKSGLSNTTVSNENNFEFSNRFRSLSLIL